MLFPATTTSPSACTRHGEVGAVAVEGGRNAGVAEGGVECAVGVVAGHKYDIAGTFKAGVAKANYHDLAVGLHDDLACVVEAVQHRRDDQARAAEGGIESAVGEIGASTVLPAKPKAKLSPTRI